MKKLLATLLILLAGCERAPEKVVGDKYVGYILIERCKKIEMGVLLKSGGEQLLLDTNESPTEWLIDAVKDIPLSNRVTYVLACTQRT